MPRSEPAKHPQSGPDETARRADKVAKSARRNGSFSVDRKGESSAGALSEKNKKRESSAGALSEKNKKRAVAASSDGSNRR